jgi:hypothetical protein
MRRRETREEAISWFHPPRVSGKEIIRRTSFRNGRAYATINDFKETGHIPDPKLVGWPPKGEDREFKVTRRGTRFADSRVRGDQSGSRKWKVFGTRFVMSLVLGVAAR